MTLTRRHLLTATSAGVSAAALSGALSPRRAVAEANKPGPPKHLIVVLVYGGWDTTYALDPKPGLAAIDAPAGEVVIPNLEEAYLATLGEVEERRQREAQPKTAAARLLDVASWRS